MLAAEVEASDAGERIDRVLARHVERAGTALSRTRLQALIAAGRLTVDGTVALDANLRAKPGARLVLDVPPPAEAEPAGEAIPLSVVFEDAHVLVLDKPAGLVVHPAAGHETGTLVNALIAHCGDTLSGIGGVRRPGIVHRLDKGTTGLMVVAKSDPAHANLAETFADHGRSGSLVREYLAFVWNVPGQRVGAVDAPLGRHPRHRDRMAVVTPEKGRHAVTHWGLDAAYPPSVALLRCRLETGRTHQIRVHMAHIGHPLVGDPVYGSGFRTKILTTAPRAHDAIQGLGRQALHAAVLGFDHPVTGETLRFESPLPADLAALLAALDAAP